MQFIVMTDAGRECGILDPALPDSESEIFIPVPIVSSHERVISGDILPDEQQVALPKLCFSVTTYHGRDGTRTRRLEVKNKDLLLLYSLPGFTPLLLSEQCSECGYHDLEEEKAMIRSGKLKVEGLRWPQK